MSGKPLGVDVPVIRPKVLGTIILLAALAACDQDPLGCAIGKLPSGYGLQQWEDNETYYLLGANEKLGGGVLEGTVLEIGWNDRVIVAKRRANFGGDPNGWMVIDLKTNAVHGLCWFGVNVTGRVEHYAHEAIPVVRG